MASREEIATLRHFSWEEFRHPAAMHFPLLQFLDQVRESFGAALELTSDGRDYVPTGGSDGSLHLRGRAVDLRWIADREARYRLVRCLVDTPVPAGEGGIELGLEPGAPGGPHIHVGLWPAPHAATLFAR